MHHKHCRQYFADFMTVASLQSQFIRLDLNTKLFFNAVAFLMRFLLEKLNIYYFIFFLLCVKKGEHNKKHSERKYKQ